MEDLQTPTHSIHVEVHLQGRQPFHGVVFSPATVRPSDSFSDLDRLLHDERRFLPVLSDADSDDRALFHKAWLQRLHLAVDPCADDDGLAVRNDGLPAPSGPACALVLSDGTRLAGELLVEAPPHASRLVDRINYARAFVPLRTAQGFVFINRECIVRVERGETCRSWTV